MIFKLATKLPSKSKNDFINHFIRQIYTSFSSKISLIENHCELKDLSFNDNLPDYEAKLIQEYYLLRYFAAYFLEYNHIYNEIINDNIIDIKNINILSLGAGALLDFYGAHFAIRDNNSCSEKQFHYTGIDVVDWNYKEKLDNTHFSFLKTNISDIELLDTGTNIIIFPKSISEFDDEVMTDLLKLIKETNFKKKTIAIVASLRVGEGGGNTEDEEKINKVVSQFIKKKYSKINNAPTKDVGDISLYYFNNSRLDYPDRIRDKVNQLLHECDKYKVKGKSCKQCENIFRSVILRTGLIRYKIIYLQKNDN